VFLSADLKIKIANQIKNNDILTVDAYQYYIKLLSRNVFLLQICYREIFFETLIAYFF